MPTFSSRSPVGVGRVIVYTTLPRLRRARVHGVGEAGVDTRQVRLLLFLHLLLSRPSFLTLVVCVIACAREKYDGAVRIERWWASSCRPPYPGARRPCPFLERSRSATRQCQG